jgi:antitoxin ParD1/3/4
MLSQKVELTEELERFVNENVKSGKFEDASDVVRTALRTLAREEHEDEAKMTELRAAIEKGDASGIAEGDVFERVRQALNLPRSPG